MLQKLGYEVSALTPVDWIDIYHRRHVLRLQLQRGPLFQEQHATLADSLAFLASQLAATHIQISMPAWVVSALLWCRLDSFIQH